MRKIDNTNTKTIGKSLLHLSNFYFIKSVCIRDASLFHVSKYNTISFENCRSKADGPPSMLNHFQAASGITSEEAQHCKAKFKFLLVVITIYIYSCSLVEGKKKGAKEKKVFIHTCGNYQINRTQELFAISMQLLSLLPGYFHGFPFMSFAGTCSTMVVGCWLPLPGEPTLPRTLR